MWNSRAFARSTAHALTVALALTVFVLAPPAQAAGGKAATFETRC